VSGVILQCGAGTGVVVWFWHGGVILQCGAGTGVVVWFWHGGVILHVVLGLVL